MKKLIGLVVALMTIVNISVLAQCGTATLTSTPYGDNTTSLQNLNVLDLSMNSKYIDFTSKFILVRALRNDLKIHVCAFF